MKALEAVFDKYRPLFEGDGKLAPFWPLFEGAETLVLTPDHKTKRGSHVRDRFDMKRMMIFVDVALLPCILLGMWNIGYQGAIAEGAVPEFWTSVLRGAWYFLPVYAVSMTAGGLAELLFCIVRKHEINEGFLVTALLFPLTLPPTIPLWMVAMGIIFGVVIGKEVFGGVGMNILNPALTARAFVFFTYPAYISGAKNAEGLGVWDVGGRWWPLGGEAAPLVDGYSGATPLLAVANGEPGQNAVEILEKAGWTFNDMFLGFIPGSMGEVSALAALIGAAFLLITGIASWRIMLGCVAGLVATTLMFNGLAGPENNALMTLPPHYHLVMGGFAFGAVYMATDPVSSAITPWGRLIYGFFIGVMCALIRVVNPAYPEGMMLAILFMNVFAPLIDYFVVRQSTRKRVARLAKAS